MQEGKWSPKVEKVIRRFEGDLDASVQLVTNSIISSIDFYQAVPREELADSVKLAISAMLQAFAERRELLGREKELLESWAQERASKGVPLEAMMGAVRDGVYIFWDEILRIAREEGTSVNEQFELGQVIWSGGNELSYPIVAGYHRAQEHEVRLDQRKRDVFLRGLLLGGEEGESVQQNMELFGISPDGPYFAFRARLYDNTPGNVKLFDRAIADLCTIGSFMAFTTVGTDVAGISTRLPMQIPPSAVIGVAGPVTADKIPGAFSMASEAMQTAYAFSRKGVFTAESLGLLKAVAKDRNIGQWAVDRYLLPVNYAGSASGSIKLTVKAMLDHDMDVDAASKALSVHPNTMRYRMKRYENLTGAKTSRVDDLVGIWWALRFSEITN
ncbi:MAG: PucR family transcriptional regulator [Acidimicrobiales bacterium]